MNLGNNEIGKSIRDAIDLQQDLDSLAVLIKKVYAALQHSRIFAELVEVARGFTPDDERPNFCEILMQDETCRLSLVGIHRFTPIPVHDHPGTAGALLAVHGRVQVRSYSIEEFVRKPSLVRLRCLSEEVLATGSVATVDRGANNLHGLQTMHLNSVCLAIHTPPPPTENQRAWYFPTHPLAIHNQHATWNRIVRPSQKIDSTQKPRHCAIPQGQ
ncbi:MAG: hypothetical protein AB8G77_09325 [Rhodothermales bacterium]